MMNDDFMEFVKEEPEEKKSQIITKKPFQVLVVDDEESVHQVTHLLLDHFEYEGAGLNLMSAYSEKEAKEILKAQSDIAVVLLDVVMGNDESGLKLVKFIREDLNNKLIRIILRTGQPGQAPEKEVIVNFDINDYKLKTELTADKIYVTMVTALRSYVDLHTLEDHKRVLERTIEATTKLYENRKLEDFVEAVNWQFRRVILGDGDTEGNSFISSMTLNINQGKFYVYSALGQFEGKEGECVDDFLEPVAVSLLNSINESHSHDYRNEYFAGYLEDVDKEGALFLVKMDSHINEWNKNMLRIFYSTVSVVYANLKLSQDVELTQKEVIFALGEVAEARSQETGHHVKRVSEYSRLFAELLGFDEEQTDLLTLASPVHDIGKLTIPDLILNKPGRLDQEEFEVIKTHTTSGYEILKGSNKRILKTAALIALRHHERWNGTGYPDGLKQEEIHIFGRIVAICDVFDALSCERVYKKAWSIEEIEEYMKQERGEQFDPNLVDVFLDNIHRFMEIHNRLI